MFDLSLFQWIIVIVAFILVGINKTGFPSLGVLVVTMMMHVFPAKEAVGIMLPMLLVADTFAILYYRQNVAWKLLFSLLPWVLGGIIIGAFTLQFLTDDTLRIMIGIIVLVLITLQLTRNFFGKRFNQLLPESSSFGAFMGLMSGFTTMVGNAAGEVMSIYFLVKQLPKKEFVGTVAWFFFIVNLIKLPIFIYLDMLHIEALKFDLMLAPIIIVGAILGLKLLDIVPQKMFQIIILFLATIGGISLLI